MLTEENRKLLVDWQRRKIISSLNETEAKEQEFPEENEWRDTHLQSHFRREVMILLSGSHSLGFRDKTYLAEPGTMLLVNSRERHDNQYFPGNGKSAHLWLIIRGNVINCQGDEFENGRLRIKFRYLYTEGERIAELNRIWDAAARGRIPPEHALFAIHSLLNLVIFGMLNADKLRLRALDPREDAVEKAKSYLEDTCGRGCSIPFLASLTGFSPMHFQRLFRKNTGRSVGCFIRELRLKRCEELAGICTQKEIAEELGFSSVSSFCNWKRKIKAGNSANS